MPKQEYEFDKEAFEIAKSVVEEVKDLSFLSSCLHNICFVKTVSIGTWIAKIKVLSPPIPMLTNYQY